MDFCCCFTHVHHSASFSTDSKFENYESQPHMQPRIIETFVTAVLGISFLYVQPFSLNFSYLGDCLAKLSPSRLRTVGSSYTGVSETCSLRLLSSYSRRVFKFGMWHPGLDQLCSPPYAYMILLAATGHNIPPLTGGTESFCASVV